MTSLRIQQLQQTIERLQVVMFKHDATYAEKVGRLVLCIQRRIDKQGKH